MIFPCQVQAQHSRVFLEVAAVGTEAKEASCASSSQLPRAMRLKRVRVWRSRQSGSCPSEPRTGAVGSATARRPSAPDHAAIARAGGREKAGWMCCGLGRAGVLSFGLLSRTAAGLRCFKVTHSPSVAAASAFQAGSCGNFRWRRESRERGEEDWESAEALGDACCAPLKRHLSSSVLPLLLLLFSLPSSTFFSLSFCHRQGNRSPLFRQ